MKRLTDEEKRSYIDNDGAFCPYCGKAKLAAMQGGFIGTSYVQDVRCQGCGREFQDVYTLTGIDVYDENGDLI